MIDLGTLEALPAVRRRWNASGQVVGVASTAGNAASHAFSWTENGGWSISNSRRHD